MGGFEPARCWAEEDIGPTHTAPTQCVAFLLADEDHASTVVNPGPPNYHSEALRQAYSDTVGDAVSGKHLHIHGLSMWAQRREFAVDNE